MQIKVRNVQVLDGETIFDNIETLEYKDAAAAQDARDEYVRFAILNWRQMHQRHYAETVDEDTIRRSRVFMHLTCGPNNYEISKILSIDGFEIASNS